MTQENRFKEAFDHFKRMKAIADNKGMTLGHYFCELPQDMADDVFLAIAICHRLMQEPSSDMNAFILKAVNTPNPESGYVYTGDIFKAVAYQLIKEVEKS